MAKKLPYPIITAIFLNILAVATMPSCKPAATTTKSPAAAPAAAAATTPDPYIPPAVTPIAPLVPAAPTAFNGLGLSGCLKTQPMQQVEFLLNGAIEAPSIIDDSAKNPRNNDGVPGQMTFEFNTGLAYSATDAMAQLRNNQGRIIIKDLASYTVDQIAYIKISLDGHTFESTPFSDWDFLRGQITKYQVVESSRVLINGQEFYRLGAVKKTLRADDNTWTESKLSENLVSKKILTQTCPPPTAAAVPAAANVGPLSPGPVVVTP